MRVAVTADLHLRESNPERSENLEVLIRQLPGAGIRQLIIAGDLPSLFDLLVLKGAELEILRQQGGLTRSYLKSLMTRERLYENLRERLPGEIGYTEFKEGVLIPKRRIGAYKSYEGFQARLSALEAIAEQFYSSLSRTELLAGLRRRGALKREQEQLQLAKRHSAYLLHRSTVKLALELERFDEQQVEDLADAVKESLRIKADRVEVPEEQWERLARELKAATRRLRIDYNLTKQRLDDLGVDEADYLEQAAELTYSRRREEEIAGELEQLESTIRTLQEGNREIREQLIEHVGRETALSGSMEALAAAIEEKKREYRRQMRETLALMIAGHVLNEVLERFRKLEDRQRREQLVLQALQIVQSGWQVIYLTMDDDIRDRFLRASKTQEEGMFRQVEL